MTAPDRPRPRHLMDPADPRPPQATRGAMSLTRVQQWVMSSLIVTTALHFSVGLVIAGVHVDGDRAYAGEGLMVIAGIIMVLSIAAGRLVHQASPLTGWLLLGAAPTLVGLWLLQR